MLNRPDTQSAGRDRRTSARSVGHCGNEGVRQRTDHSRAILPVAFLLGLSVFAGQDTLGTAVVRGRVVAGDTGLPMRGVRVTIAQGGTPRTVATTDSRGTYEIRGLDAGIHTVRALPPDYKRMYLTTGRTAADDATFVELEAGQILEDVDFALPRAGAIGGHVVDEFGQPITGMRVEALEVRARRLRPAGAAAVSDDEGRFRVYGLSPGRYYLSASGARAQWSAEAGPNGETYIRTFYPGTTSATDAVPIVLRPSEARSNVDIRVVWSRTFAVSGVTTDPSGRPVAGATVTLTSPLEMPLARRRTASNVSGEFQFLEVVPGDYLIGARRSAESGDAGVLAARRVAVSVTTADVTNLAVALRRAVIVSGSILTEHGSLPPLEPRRLGLVPVPVVPDELAAPVERVQVRDDWTFEMPRVASPILIQVTGLPRGWFQRSVRHRGVDVGLTPVDFLEAGDPAGIVVVVSDRGATLAGAVATASGRPVPGRWVMAYPAGRDPADARFVGGRPALTDEDGRFELDTIPPGDYAVVAFDGRDARASPEETAALVLALGTPVTLAAQERKQIRLRLVAWPY